MATTPPSDDFLARLNRLEALVDEHGRNPNYPFSVLGSDGTRYFSVSPGPSGKPVITARMGVGGKIYDGSGNIIFSSDTTTGQRLSTPFFAVPWVPRWDGGHYQMWNEATLTQSVGLYTIKAAAVTAETMLWDTYIPQVLHPKVRVLINGGRISGSTSIATYRMYFNGNLIKTMVQATSALIDTGDVDITSYVPFGTEGVNMSLTIQVNVTSTDYMMCHPYPIHMVGR